MGVGGGVWAARGEKLGKGDVVVVTQCLLLLAGTH